MATDISSDIGTELLFENDRIRVWSMVLQPGEESPLHRHDGDYVFVYTTPSRITAFREGQEPVTTEYDDKTCWIWMEAVDGRTGSALTLADLDAIAYALGTTQAAYASGRADLPRAPWLSRSCRQMLVSPGTRGTRPRASQG